MDRVKLYKVYFMNGSEDVILYEYWLILIDVFYFYDCVVDCLIDFLRCFL